MKTTKEAREVIKAVGVIVVRGIEANADGKVTLRERLGFLGDAPEVWDAVKGIGEVPAELADLDENERVILTGDIRMILIDAGLTHRNSDIAEWILESVYEVIRAIAKLFHRIKDAPPTALAA